MSKATALKTESRSASVPTHMVAISDLYLASEAPKGADLQVRDSTRGSPLTDDELRASIYNNGIIVPLMWKEHAGKKYVVAGNRRLRMLREIFADSLSTPVKTENVADYPGDWRDIAMDTNLALPPHVVERYEMIARIAKEEKLPEAEICKRYGMSDSQYRRVMALGRMAPVVRDAWKASKIDAKTAQAFTLEPDAKEQEKIYLALEKQGRISDWNVRDRIVPPSQREVGQMVAFVGMDAVKKAKLLKQEDLFAGESRGPGHHVVTDVKGLKKLVGDRLAKVRDELVAAGWGWALPERELGAHEYQFGDLHPDPKKAKPTPEEKKRLAEIRNIVQNAVDTDLDSEEEDELIAEEERIEQAIACRGFSADQMKRGGCILKIGHQGELVIVYGKVKPADKAKAGAAERRLSPSSKPKPKAKPGEVLMTHALADRMSANLEEAISAAMLSSPYVCVAAMIAGFASYGELITVSVGNADKNAKYDPKFDEEKTFLQVFEGALKASPEEQVSMLAGVASKALEIHTFNAEAALFKKEGVPTLQALTKALPKAALDKLLMDCFDAMDYFSNVSIQVIADAVSCSMGPDFARDVAKMKKKEAAKFAAEYVKAKNYLPPFMRTPHYTGPIEKAAAPRSTPTPKKAPAAKKKAKAKK